MNQKELRVGIVGADNKHSWAKISHIPAVQNVPGVRLAAVATRHEESAREAAQAFGADRWFSDPYAMILDDDIDIVTVAVKMPWHRQLVLAALRAGKAVYCEAPLGRSVGETEEMARAVRFHHTAIGLQARLNPAARRAAELISSGAIGRPIDAKIVAPAAGWGPEMTAEYDLLNKLWSGADLITISGGHALDLAESVLGPIHDVVAGTEIRWPVVKLVDTGEESERETPDLLWVAGKTQSGAAFTAHFEGGVKPEDVSSRIEIRGSDGWLRLTSDHPYGFQGGDLTLTSSVPFDRPDPLVVPPDTIPSAINVAEIYASLARDLREGTHETPGFEHALHNSRLMSAVRHAAEQQASQTVSA